MRKPTTLKDLASLQCSDPNCKHESCLLVLSPRCHPNAAVVIAFHKTAGTLIVRCSTCSKNVAEILVGDLLQDHVGPAIPLPPSHYQN